MTAQTTERDQRHGSDDQRGDRGDREVTRRPRRAVIAGAAGTWLPGLLDLLLPFAGLLLLQRLLFPAPLGIVLNGALVGGRIALIALGVALVYRANRIVNFAQGDLGGVPATLAVMLVVSWGWSYWFGFVAGIAAAVVLGVLVETLVIRRFSRAPRLVLTVATLGLAQLLTGASLLVPRAFGDLIFADRLPQPFDARFDVEGTFFYANDIVTMAVVPLAFVALALFLRRSTVGIAIVGAAERADRAAGLGIPVQRLHTVVWVVASVLAFVAMYLRAGSVGLPIGHVLPAAFLVQALAAAVLGRFERFTAIAAAAIGLGIVDQAMVFQPDGSPAEGDAVLFFVVLIGLLLVRGEGRRARWLPVAAAVAIGGIVTAAMVDQRLTDGGQLSVGDGAQAVLFVAVLVGFVLARQGAEGAVGASRVDSGASTWLSVREARPIPRELARLPEVRLVRIGLWVVLVVAVLTLPDWLSTSHLNLATLVVLFGVVAASLVVLTGWAGQVSLGHMAFVGLGAAVGGALTQARGWILPVTMLVAGMVGAVVAVVVGYPALRRRGLTLAVSTLAFALFTASYLLNPGVFDWLPTGQLDAPTLVPAIRVGDSTLVDRVLVESEEGLFNVSAVVLGLALLMVSGLRRTRTGRVLIAIRENERATRAYGVNTTRTTLAAFALSGFLAALAGSLVVYQQGELTADRYLPQASLALFSMVVIGGVGSLPGALLGATYVQAANFFLPLRWQFLASGAGLLLVLLIFPSGLGAALTEVRDAGLRWIARRRGLVVPSLMGESAIGAGDPGGPGGDGGDGVAPGPDGARAA